MKKMTNTAAVAATIGTNDMADLPVAIKKELEGWWNCDRRAIAEACGFTWEDILDENARNFVIIDGAWYSYQPHHPIERVVMGLEYHWDLLPADGREYVSRLVREDSFGSHTGDIMETGPAAIEPWKGRLNEVCKALEMGLSDEHIALLYKMGNDRKDDVTAWTAMSALACMMKEAEEGECPFFTEEAIEYIASSGLRCGDQDRWDHSAYGVCYPRDYFGAAIDAIRAGIAIEDVKALVDKGYYDLMDATYARS